MTIENARINFRLFDFWILEQGTKLGRPEETRLGKPEEPGQIWQCNIPEEPRLGTPWSKIPLLWDTVRTLLGRA